MCLVGDGFMLDAELTAAAISFLLPFISLFSEGLAKGSPSRALTLHFPDIALCVRTPETGSLDRKTSILRGRK